MFRKELKIKNNAQLKGSDKKKLMTSILSSFPTITEEELMRMFPNKESIIQMKILLQNGNLVTVYFVRGQPLIFSINNKLYPTVYFLWQYDNLLSSFIISPYVLDKLVKGADLMVPGIIKNTDKPSFGKIQVGDTVSIHLSDNKASVAIGTALMNSCDVESSGHGKAVNIIHTIDDGIFKLANEKMEIPVIPLVKPEIAVIDSPEDICPFEKISEEEPIEKLSEELSELDISYKEDKKSADEILLDAFLYTLKTEIAKLHVPILTNLFYKNFVLKSIPKMYDFDIKKTKYKKLSVFLAEMEKLGIVQLEISPKNVQSIVAIDFNNKLVVNSVDMIKSHKEDKKTALIPEKTLEIVEHCVVNSLSQDLFLKCGFKKGDLFSVKRVREIVINYVKEHNLQDEEDKRSVILDPVLAKIVNSKSNKVEWKWLIEKMIANMGNSYEVIKNGSPVSSGRGKIPLIDINLKVRSGNKKVTCLDNLETYGIDLTEISRQCQHSLAASTTLNKVPSKKTHQLQIQGNHINYMKKLLIEKYLIPKRYILDHNDSNPPKK